MDVAMLIGLKTFWIGNPSPARYLYLQGEPSAGHPKSNLLLLYLPSKPSIFQYHLPYHMSNGSSNCFTTSNCLSTTPLHSSQTTRQPCSSLMIPSSTMIKTHQHPTPLYPQLPHKGASQYHPYTQQGQPHGHPYEDATSRNPSRPLRTTSRSFRS